MFQFNWTPFSGALVGAAAAFLFTILRERYKSPMLKYKKISGPWTLEKKYGDSLPDELNGAYAYRLRIENRKKSIFISAAAENCVCWLNIDGVEETFRLPWIGGGSSVTINVEDYRELDFCARSTKTGRIIAPSIEGYNHHIIPIGNGSLPITGFFRVTSKNGKKEERKFEIIPIENNKLQIKIDKENSSANHRRAQDILIGTLFGLILGIISNLWVSVFSELFIKNMSPNRLILLLILYSAGIIFIGALLWIYIKKLEPK